MSQNDFVIADQAMPAARTDVNSALQALASVSKGPSAPTTAYSGQLWLDDDTPSATAWTLNVYDGTDWIAIGQIDTTANTFTATNAVKTTVAPSFTVAINEAAYADVASATTTDLGAVASNNVRITGTTTITGLGSGAAGITRRVRFAGALTLTFNATSLILPSGATITTAADDMAVFTSLGSSNWICVNYDRKSGSSLVSGGLSAATQAEQETGTSTTVAVSPGTQQFHPSAAKAWVKFNMSAVVSASHNVTSVTDSAVADFTINWNTDFSTANYAVAGGIVATASIERHLLFFSPAVGTTRIMTSDVSNNQIETSTTDFMVVAYGDHA